MFRSNDERPPSPDANQQPAWWKLAALGNELGTDAKTLGKKPKTAARARSRSRKRFFLPRGKGLLAAKPQPAPEKQPRAAGKEAEGEKEETREPEDEEDEEEGEETDDIDVNNAVPTAWKKWRGENVKGRKPHLGDMTAFANFRMNQGYFGSIVSYLSKVYYGLTTGEGLTILHEPYVVLLKRCESEMEKRGVLPAKAFPVTVESLGNLKAADKSVAITLMYAGLRLKTIEDIDPKSVKWEKDDLVIGVEESEKRKNYHCTRLLGLAKQKGMAKKAVNDFFALSTKGRKARIKALLKKLNEDRGTRPHFTRHSFRRFCSLMLRRLWESLPTKQQVKFRTLEENACGHQGWSFGKSDSSFTKYSSDHVSHKYKKFLPNGPILHLAQQAAHQKLAKNL
jgi:hypothetical protein